MNLNGRAVRGAWQGAAEASPQQNFLLDWIQTWILMNEDPPRGIQPSHSELEAQYAEPGPAVVWAYFCGRVLQGVALQLIDCFHDILDHQSDVALTCSQESLSVYLIMMWNTE